MTSSTRQRVALLGSVLMIGVAAAPAQAQASEARWQIGSALASVLYAPVKVAYAAAGALVGGIAWGLSGGDEGALRAVLDPAVHGDYLVTPEHLRGERPLAFVGSESNAEPDPTVAGYGEPADSYVSTYDDEPADAYDSTYYDDY